MNNPCSPAQNHSNLLPFQKSSRKRKPQSSLAVLAVGAIISGNGPAARAADAYWITTSGTSNWSTLGNWSINSDGTGGNPAAVPGVLNTAYFDSSNNNNTVAVSLSNTALSVGGMVFSNTGTTALVSTANVALTVGAGGIMINGGAGPVTIGTITFGRRIGLVLGASQSWTNNSGNAFNLNANNTIDMGSFTLTSDGSGDTSAAGVISSGTMVKNGAGTLTLSAANTFAGGLTIKQGTVRAITSTSALGGTGSGTVSLGDAANNGLAATLLGDGRTFANPITLTSNASAGTLTVGNSASGTIFSGGVTGTNGFTINNSGAAASTLTFQTGDLASTGLITSTGTSTGATTISSNITSANTVGITQNSSGSLVLSGTNNAYSGTTTLTTGILQALVSGSSLTPVNPLGTSGLALNGGTLQLRASGNLTTTAETITFGNNATVGGDTTIDVNRPGATSTSKTIALGTLAIGANTLNVTGGNTYGLSFGAVTASGAATLNPTTGTFNFTSLTLANSVGTGTTTTETLDGTVAGFVTGVISDNSGDATKKLALAKTNSSTWTLSGANTYTGPTTISAGTLSISATNNLGAAASNLIFDGGTLQITGTLINSVNGAGSIGHAVTTNAGKSVGLDIASGNVFTFDQVLNQTTGGLTKLGAGALVLNQANTYSGLTTIASGTLVIGASNQLGDGSATNTLNLNSNAVLESISGSFDLGSTRAVFLAGNGLINADSGATLTVSGTISGAAGKSLIAGGGGTLILTGSNTFTGPAIIRSGVLSVSTVGNSGAASNLGAGSTINLGFAAGSPTLRYAGTGETTDKTVTFTGGSTEMATLEQAGTGLLKFTSTASPSNVAQTLVLAGATAGSGELAGPISLGNVTKNGSGLWTLSGTNTYAGVTTISSGTLSIAAIAMGGTASGIGASTSAATNLVLGGGTLLYTGTSANTDRGFTTTSTASTIEVSNAATTLTISGSSATGSGGLTKAGAGTLTLTGSHSYTGATTVNSGTLQIGDGTSGSLASTSAITVNSGGTLALNLAGSGTFANGITTTGNQGAAFVSILGSGTTIFSNNITGPGVLNQNGVGLTILTGNDTYAGATNINSGVLQLAWSGVSNLSTINVGVDNGLTFGISSATIGGLGGSGGVVLANGTSAVTLTLGGNNQDTTYSGVLSGSGSLVKNGTGALTLGGSNTYTGATTINTGTLTFSGNNRMAPGSAITLNGGTLDLGGYSQAMSAIFTFSGQGAFQNGNLNSSGALRRSGSGTALFSGTGSFNGLTASGGTLEITSGGSLTSANRLLLQGAGATLQLDAGAVASFSGNGTGTSNIVGADSGAGILNMNGGTLNFTSGANGSGYLRVGANAAPGTGNMTVNGGTANIGHSMNIGGRFDNSQTASTNSGTLTIAGGTVNIGTGTDAATTNGVNGALYLKNNAAGTTGTATVNLNGGTLSLKQLIAGTQGTSIVNLNGGTLQARASSASFLDASDGLTVNVQDGGATIDTQANNITIGAALIASGTGGLTKVGSGALTLTGSNSYSGATTLSNGSLVVGNANALGTGGLTVNSGTLDLSGYSVSVTTFSGTGASASVTNSGSGTSTLTTTVASGTANYAGNIANGTGAIVLTNSGAGTLVLSGSLTMAGLNANSGVMQLAQSGSIGAIAVSGSGSIALTAHSGAYNVLDTSSLSIASGGSIDLWNNAMVLRASGTAENATNLTTVKAAVNAASNGLQWNGTGLGSTTAFNEAGLGKTQALAVMVYDNTVIKQSSFEGISGLGYFDSETPVGFNQVLVKLTYLGDFNADGVINASDYTWLDGYALGSNNLGDLNGDGLVNATDYTWLDGSALNQSFGVLAGQLGGADATPTTQIATGSPTGTVMISPEAVPEPGSLGLLLTGVLGLLGFRPKSGRRAV